MALHKRMSVTMMAYDDDKYNDQRICQNNAIQRMALHKRRSMTMMAYNDYKYNDKRIC